MTDPTALLMVSSGVAIIAGIGAYKLAEHRFRRRITYVVNRNTELRDRLAAALDNERGARTVMQRMQRENDLLHAREAAWAKRILAGMPTVSYSEDSGQ